MSVVSPLAPASSPNWNANAIQKAQIMCRRTPSSLVYNILSFCLDQRGDASHTSLDNLRRRASGGPTCAESARFLSRERFYLKAVEEQQELQGGCQQGRWINKDRGENASENENKIGNTLLRCVCLSFATRSIVTLSGSASLSNLNGVALFLGLSEDFRFALEV